MSLFVCLFFISNVALLSCWSDQASGPSLRGHPVSHVHSAGRAELAENAARELTRRLPGRSYTSTLTYPELLLVLLHIALHQGKAHRKQDVVQYCKGKYTGHSLMCVSCVDGRWKKSDSVAVKRSALQVVLVKVIAAAIGSQARSCWHAVSIQWGD